MTVGFFGGKFIPFKIPLLDPIKELLPYFVKEPLADLIKVSLPDSIRNL